MNKQLQVTAFLKIPLIIRGFMTFDALLEAILFEKYQYVEKAHSEIPIQCDDGLFHASAAQLHSKIIIVDADQLCIGSYNWLSANRKWEEHKA